MELQGGCSSKKENDHAISMVLAMIIAFFVCWLPYTALSVVVVIDPELYIPPLVATMPMYFAKTSPVYNPIIYFLSNKQVRSSNVFVPQSGIIRIRIVLVTKKISYLSFSSGIYSNSLGILNNLWLFVSNSSVI